MKFVLNRYKIIDGGKKMDQKKIGCYESRLIPGNVYWDKKNNELVEFGYMGQTGKAIVYEPGDSGGGMQSSWAINPENLIESGGLEKIIKK